MSGPKLGDFIIAVPRERPAKTEESHTVFVRGIVLWDYGNGTILVHTRNRSHVCLKPTHPVIVADADLTNEERLFAAKTRDELVEAAKRHLASLA